MISVKKKYKFVSLINRHYSDHIFNTGAKKRKIGHTKSTQ